MRVALFGLSKLQTRMNDLNQEIKVKNRELEKGNSSWKHEIKNMKM